jgi:hypothetical protein
MKSCEYGPRLLGSAPGVDRRYLPEANTLAYYSKVDITQNKGLYFLPNYHVIFRN